MDERLAKVIDEITSSDAIWMLVLRQEFSLPNLLPQFPDVVDVTEWFGGPDSRTYLSVPDKMMIAEDRGQVGLVVFALDPVLPTFIRDTDITKVTLEIPEFDGQPRHGVYVKKSDGGKMVAVGAYHTEVFVDQVVSDGEAHTQQGWIFMANSIREVRVLIVEMLLGLEPSAEAADAVFSSIYVSRGRTANGARRIDSQASVMWRPLDGDNS